MPSEATLRLSGGGDLVRFVSDQAAALAAPTQEDVLSVIEAQKTRILDRTLTGVDFEGRAFAPYSTTRPYYYYPGTKGASIKSRKAAVRRLLKITGDVAAHRMEYLGSESAGGRKTRDGLGIRFDSYADFKASLGRAGVDLTGPKAPHMLQALVTRVLELGNGEFDARIGIYSADKTEIAEYHNAGTAHMPRRQFLGYADADTAALKQDLARRIEARLSKTR